VRARPLVRCAAIAAAAALALPASAGALVTPGSTAPPREQLQLVLPLRTDGAALTRFADAVSEPGSPSYGHYRSIAWLSRHFGASASTRGRVVTYLRAHGARDVVSDATGQFVYARMAVADADSVFRTSLSEERGARAARFVAPVTAVVLPKALHGLVTGVVGLDSTPVATDTLPPSSGYQGPDPTARPKGCRAGVGEGGFTPNEYLGAYDYAPLQQQGLLGQGERVALVEIDGFRSRDLTRFAECFRLNIPQINGYGVGVGKSLPPGGEATLDLEVLDAAAPDLRSINVYETSPDAADVLRAISQPLQNPGFKPQVISVSLGLCESETVAGVGKAGIGAIESTLKLAAAAGISVLGASGDFGSADCAQPDSNPPTPNPALAVNFPSSSPWVTSVGGTNLNLDKQNQIVSQSVWNDAGAIPGNASGGGVSMLFARPSWQAGVIKSGWRAQPDVAMLADVSPGYAVYCTASEDCHARGWETFGGTSAATPLMAGGFALVDELLRRHDEQPLGLANPLLYRLGRNSTTAAQVYYDVTSGSNDIGPFIRASQQPLGCCSARPGYDEASGWGGVNLDALAQHALSLQHKLANVTLTLPGGQHPYASEGIQATVGCTGPCDMTAYAQVTVKGGRSFVIYSPLVHLVHRNRRLLKLPFTVVQMQEIRMALAAHRRVAAAVTGAVVDAGGNLEHQTAPEQLMITS
jgi:kumamolisin